jgi:hypothetical protein
MCSIILSLSRGDSRPPGPPGGLSPSPGSFPGVSHILFPRVFREESRPIEGNPFIAVVGKRDPSTCMHEGDPLFAFVHGQAPCTADPKP